MEEEEYKTKAEHILDMLIKQDYCCYITGKKFTKLNVDLEHIIPLHRGGKHERSNLCLIEKAFSGLKRYYSVEEIREICSIVVNDGK